MADQYFPSEGDTFSEPRAGLSPGAKIGIGCGVSAFVAVILCCSGIFVGMRSYFGQFEDFVNDFEQRGYVRMEGTGVRISDQIKERTVIKARAVEIANGARTDLAIAAQVARIDGTIEGDLDFIGLALYIESGAVIEGDLNVRWAMAVEVNGTVEGSITGEYWALQQAPPPQPPPTPPPPPGEAPPDEGGDLQNQDSDPDDDAQREDDGWHSDPPMHPQ